MIKDFRMTEAACPKCGRLNDGALATVEGSNGPKVGDLTICIGCHFVSIFDDHMEPRKMTVEERAAFDANPVVAMGVARALRLLQRAKAQTN